MEFVEMKDRIAHIIRAKNLTAADFALRLGIQPSNISHLLSGRNNPSLEFVRKLKETFPEYNLDWIVFGKGPMTVSEPFAEPKPMVEAQTMEPKPVENEVDIFEDTLFTTEKTSSSVEPKSIPLPNEVKRIIMVYADNSFEILSPR
jgi:transcriptional regulator with XRE-family HTH domain